VEVLGGKHDLPTWGRIFPEFLQWAFASLPEPVSSADSHLADAKKGDNTNAPYRPRTED
jgi:hypothetical protein